MTLDILQFIADQRNLVGDDESVTVRGVLDELTERLRAAMDVEYVGALYCTDYSVTGSGPFPVDMLRYTQSWPATEADAIGVEESLEHASYDDPFTIRLTKYHRDPKPNLCEDRWQSKFRWKIVGVVETAEL